MLERLKKLRLTPIIQYIWSRTSDFFKKGDMFLLTMCCICTCFGITLVASATKSYPSHTFVPIQIFAFILGLFLYYVLTVLDVSILAPYDPSIDPDGWGITWQTTRSKYALMGGQATGLGLGHGTQTQSGALTGKHTDFIFSVAGEELGMVACVLIMLLLSVVIIRCMMVGLRSNNTMSMLVCVGVAASIFFQMLVNTGMCIGITPVIGITLPFFSYGGSSLMSTFGAVGLVSGAKYRPTPLQFHRF